MNALLPQGGTSSSSSAPSGANATHGKRTLTESCVTQDQLESRAKQAELRGMLYAAVVGDVEEAARNFALAAVAKAVDIKITPEKTPLLVSLALDLAGELVLRGLKSAAASARASAEAVGAISEVQAVYSDLPVTQVSERISNLAADVRAVPEALVEAGAHKAVELGKGAAEAAIPHGDDKGAQLAWIAAMQRGTDVQMTTLRDQAMLLSAPELILWRLAWARVDHSQDAYTFQINRALVQFAQVSEIGLPYPWRKAVRVLGPQGLRMALIDDVHGDGQWNFVTWIDDQQMQDFAATKTRDEHAGAVGYSIELVHVPSWEAFMEDPGVRS